MKRLLVFTAFSLLAIPSFGQKTSSGAINGHDYVDLGLSVLWATCDVGASSFSDDGTFYYWGDTKPARRVYDFSEIKYITASDGKRFSKYNTDSEYGTVDNKTVLDLSDDVARAKWGGGWRMPTVAEIEELLTRCKWTWIEKWEGYRVEGPNGSTIMMKAVRDTRYSFWWSNSLDSGDSFYARALYLTDRKKSLSSQFRIRYARVRPVADKGISQSGNASRSGNAVQKENGHSYVDLGLSVKWATCNIGASKPEDYGDYYAWGETSTKSFYTEENYKFYNGYHLSLNKYCDNGDYGSYGYRDNRITLEMSDDVARQKWGGRWRMPTRKECKELEDNCKWTRTTMNGVEGYKVTSKKNGNSLFLPATGRRRDTGFDEDGFYGHYWSSSLFTDDSPYKAWNLYFDSDCVGWGDSFRCYGLPVRPVTE